MAFRRRVQPIPEGNAEHAGEATAAATTTTPASSSIPSPRSFFSSLTSSPSASSASLPKTALVSRAWQRSRQRWENSHVGSSIFNIAGGSGPSSPEAVHRPLSAGSGSATKAAASPSQLPQPTGGPKAIPVIATASSSSSIRRPSSSRNSSLPLAASSTASASASPTAAPSRLPPALPSSLPTTPASTRPNSATASAQSAKDRPSSLAKFATLKSRLPSPGGSTTSPSAARAVIPTSSAKAVAPPERASSRLPSPSSQQPTPSTRQEGIPTPSTRGRSASASSGPSLPAPGSRIHTSVAASSSTTRDRAGSGNSLISRRSLLGGGGAAGTNTQQLSTPTSRRSAEAEEERAREQQEDGYAAKVLARSRLRLQQAGIIVPTRSSGTRSVAQGRGTRLEEAEGVGNGKGKGTSASASASAPTSAAASASSSTISVLLGRGGSASMSARGTPVHSCAPSSQDEREVMADSIAGSRSRSSSRLALNGRLSESSPSDSSKQTALNSAPSSLPSSRRSSISGSNLSSSRLPSAAAASKPPSSSIGVAVGARMARGLSNSSGGSSSGDLVIVTAAPAPYRSGGESVGVGGGRAASRPPSSASGEITSLSPPASAGLSASSGSRLLLHRRSSTTLPPEPEEKGAAAVAAGGAGSRSDVGPVPKPPAKNAGERRAGEEESVDALPPPRRSYSAGNISASRLMQSQASRAPMPSFASAVILSKTAAAAAHTGLTTTPSGSGEHEHDGLAALRSGSSRMRSGSHASGGLPTAAAVLQLPRRRSNTAGVETPLHNAAAGTSGSSSGGTRSLDSSFSSGPQAGAVAAGLLAPSRPETTISAAAALMRASSTSRSLLARRRSANLSSEALVAGEHGGGSGAAVEGGGGGGGPVTRATAGTVVMATGTGTGTLPGPGPASASVSASATVRLRSASVLALQQDNGAAPGAARPNLTTTIPITSTAASPRAAAGSSSSSMSRRSSIEQLLMTRQLPRRPQSVSSTAAGALQGDDDDGEEEASDSAPAVPLSTSRPAGLSSALSWRQRSRRSHSSSTTTTGGGGGGPSAIPGSGPATPTSDRAASSGRMSLLMHSTTLYAGQQQQQQQEQHRREADGVVIVASGGSKDDKELVDSSKNNNMQHMQPAGPDDEDEDETGTSTGPVTTSTASTTAATATAPTTSPHSGTRKSGPHSETALVAASASASVSHHPQHHHHDHHHIDLDQHHHHHVDDDHVDNDDTGAHPSQGIIQAEEASQSQSSSGSGTSTPTVPLSALTAASAPASLASSPIREVATLPPPLVPPLRSSVVSTSSSSSSTSISTTGATAAVSSLINDPVRWSSSSSSTMTSNGTSNAGPHPSHSHSQSYSQMPSHPQSQYYQRHRADSLTVESNASSNGPPVSQEPPSSRIPDAVSLPVLADSNSPAAKAVMALRLPRKSLGNTSISASAPASATSSPHAANLANSPSAYFPSTSPYPGSGGQGPSGLGYGAVAGGSSSSSNGGGEGGGAPLPPQPPLPAPPSQPGFTDTDGGPHRFPAPFAGLSVRSTGLNGYSSPHPSSGLGAGIGTERERDFPSISDSQTNSHGQETDGSPTSRPQTTTAPAPPTVSPIIKIKPEYSTVYRKDPSGGQGKQNVVCVISIEMPSRRPQGAYDGRPPPHSQSRLAAAAAPPAQGGNAGAGGMANDLAALSVGGRGWEQGDAHSLDGERSGSDADLAEHKLRYMQRTGTGTGTATGTAASTSSVGVPAPRSPSFHTRTASNDDRHMSGGPFGSNPLGSSGSETGFRSAYTRSDEKLPGQKEPGPTLGSSPEEAPFSFGATPAKAPSTGDQVLQAATEDLRLRVVDWKGHGPSEFGPLLTFGFLSVRQTSVIRHFHVFLFREVLLCISEEKKKSFSRFILKGSSSTPSGPATGAPVNDRTLASLSANAQTAPALKLKGRIYLRHIRKIACSPPKVENTINIKLDDDSLDQFVLVFSKREEMDAWAKHITGQLSHNALARSTVYGISNSPFRTASEPGRPTPGLGIEFTGGVARSYVGGPSDSNSVVSSSTVAFPPLNRASRRTDSLSKKPAAPSPFIPSPLPGVPPNNLPMSPASVVSLHRTRSRSPGAPSRSSAYGTDRSASRSRPSPGGAGPITTVAADDAPYARWSSSGGFNPSQPAPPLLPHSPVDLVVLISVPTAAIRAGSTMSTATLKLRAIRGTLELIISSMGPRDRLALVTYSIGQEGSVRRTALLNSHKQRSADKFQQFVRSIEHGWQGEEEDPFLEDVGRSPASSSAEGGVTSESVRIDMVSAINIGMDIMLQRKSKNPVSGMLLITDVAEQPRRGDVDFLLARAETAGMPIHSFGFGKHHDAQTLWHLSNYTHGLYTFVPEWDQLQECLMGCIGSLTSVALIDFKVHIGVPSDNHFRVRKISGPVGAGISSSGKDVDIEIGELYYGGVKEIFVELDLDYNGLIPFIPETHTDGRALVRGISTALVEEGSATDDLLQRLGLRGIQGGAIREVAPGPMIEDVAVLEVDASYRDTSSARTPFQTPHPTVLTLAIDATSPDPLSEASPGAVAVLADPYVTRRRLEILVSEMISRSLNLALRQNDRQALAVLSETRRIVEIVVQAMSGFDRQALPASQRRVRKPREFASMATIDTFYGILEDLDLLLDGLEHARHSFDRELRNYATQQAMILRDQKAWTTRTLLEYIYFRDDNGPALTAHGAILGRTSVRQ